MGQLIGFSSLPLRFSFPVSFGVTFEIKHVKKKKKLRSCRQIFVPFGHSYFKAAPLLPVLDVSLHF